MADAIADVHDFQFAFNVVEDSPDRFEGLLRLLSAHLGAGKQVHDANLVATMLANGIGRLLTFNAADFRRFGGLIEVVTP